MDNNNINNNINHHHLNHVNNNPQQQHPNQQNQLNQHHLQQMPVEEDDDDNRADVNPNVDEEEEEDEEEDEDEPLDNEEEEDGGLNPGEEDTLEGGVAEGDESCKLASEADIVLYFLCTEQFKEHPDHPILRPGVKVRIGMGKVTRLSAVMTRYVEVCNQVRTDASGNAASFAPIDPFDLEFVHASVLKGQDTAEQAALMKDDVVRVRRNRWEEMEQEHEANKLQRDSDFTYFEHMRQAMEKPSFSTVVLDCQGSALPSLPFPRSLWINLPVPKNTKVYCDAALISKRCRWLARLIEGTFSGIPIPEAPGQRTKSIVSLPEHIIDGAQGDPDGGGSGQEDGAPQNNIMEEDDLDEHPIQVLDFDPQQMVDRSRMLPNAEALVAAAAQIEIDEMDSACSDADDSRGDSMRFNMEQRHRIVIIRNHAPEVMKLLLEYCYTNRVICLGHEAFRIAAKTKPLPREGKGNLPPPGTKRWANRGEPTIPFEWAAAAISLAEEASMPRFSLMCEVAASHLVTPQNVVEALALCKQTQDSWGNPLPKLRRAAMDVVFHSKAYGHYDCIYKQVSFREALEDKAPLLVPTLFTGTADAVEDSLGSKRYHSFRERDWKSTMVDRLRRYDQEDKLNRAQERSRYRKNHDGGSGSEDHPLIVDELDALGTDAASRKSIKRLRGHSMRLSLRRVEKRERRSTH